MKGNKQIQIENNVELDAGLMEIPYEKDRGLPVVHYHDSLGENYANACIPLVMNIVLRILSKMNAEEAVRYWIPRWVPTKVLLTD